MVNETLIVKTFLSFVLALYTGLSLLSLFNQKNRVTFRKRKLFWCLILLASLSFVLVKVMPFSVYWIPLFGYSLFALLLCLFFSCIIFDLFFIGYKLLKHHPLEKTFAVRSSFFGCFILVLIIGLYAANYPRITYYHVKINKSAQVKQLRIVQLTDIHISELTSVNYIKTMVERVNQLKPDYIVITGDTLDKRLKPFVNKQMPNLFAQLKSTYGTIIIFGNHEHYGVQDEENIHEQAIIQAFEAGNMTVLKDNVLFSPQTGVYIIGRDDNSIGRYGRHRASLNSLMAQVNQEQPVILLDHQPLELDKAADLGVDILFSGHTHGGQIFPFTLLVKLKYENSWGIMQKQRANHHFTSIVSSGYGLWGPPIRIMSRAEIVVTDIHFNE
jgi:uncharacterized protein